MYEAITFSVDARGIATLTLNQPDKRNALSARMIAELTDCAAQIDRSDAVRAVHLKGNGRMFCAGGDLGWMRDQIRADRATRISEARKLANLLNALNSLSKPLIASVHGSVFGGGIGMMCVADKVIAAEGTTFGLTETRLGLIPATIGPYVLARMGEGKAREVMMSATLFDAERAKELNLVSRIVPPEELDLAAGSELAAYLSVAPRAVTRAKALARALGPRIDDAVIEMSVEQLANCWEDEEAIEGINAFFEKRDPPWRR